MKKVTYLSIAIFICNFSFSQPTQVKDIDTYCCLGGSLPSSLIVYNNLIFFSASDNSGSNTPGNQVLGRELWISDGTNSGTLFLKDINSGSAGSSPNNFFVYNNNLYFTANTGAGNVLFTSDGTEVGTVTTGNGPIGTHVELGGLIYYINPSGNKLNQFNGTTSSAVAGSGNEFIINNQIIAYNGKIFCYMNKSTESGTYGSELYAYDPALDSFQLVKDIGGGQLDSDLANFTVLGTDLYFSAFSELALWKTDGTNAGTVMISTPPEVSSFDGFYAWNGLLFFEGYDENPNKQLWIYNPVDDNVTKLSNLTGTYKSHNPSDYTELNGWLYYSGKQDNNNNKFLWRTNSLATYQLDNTITNIGSIVALNNKLYFGGNNGFDGNELFEFDPSTLSVDKLNTNKEIVIYPNPSKGNISISRDFQDIINYELLEINGRTIQKGLLENNTINYQLKTGMYLLNLKNSEINITKKIIVN